MYRIEFAELRMDKQKAKRAAALSAATAVGSVGGSFGSDVIIDKKQPITIVQ